MVAEPQSLTIRCGTAADLPELDQIAFAAKASWGYTAEQLTQWRADLETTQESLGRRPVFVAEVAGRAAGFIQVATDTSPWEVWALWVTPERMRQGIGTALLTRAKQFGCRAGQVHLAVDADPNAENFYLNCGARLVGHVAAPISGYPERTRPQLLLPTSAV